MEGVQHRVEPLHRAFIKGFAEVRGKELVHEGERSAGGGFVTGKVTGFLDHILEQSFPQMEGRTEWKRPQEREDLVSRPPTTTDRPHE
jgi:hypothetical protein